MKVTGIDILGLRYDATAAYHEGYVTLQIKPTVAGAAPLLVQYLCHSGQGESAPASLITHELIGDALRQAHRMPGFRRGEQKIEVAIAAGGSLGHAAPA